MFLSNLYAFLEMHDYLRIFIDPFDTIWWLGRNYYNAYGDTWPGQTEPAPGYRNPDIRNALPVIIAMAIACTIIRVIFQKYIASLLATLMGIKQCKAQCNMLRNYPTLEADLKKNRYKTLKDGVLQEICNNIGITLKEGQIWVRRRQQAILSTRHTKFVESCWRFVFYGGMFCYGIMALWTEDYLWDTKLCWQGYPFETWTVKEKIYWYYMIELGYYVSCLVFQFYEVKRKDFTQMFIHHIATVILISMSFVTSRTKIGSLVIVVHDFSDISLEACKMAKYAKFSTAANTLFASFGISFFVSRIIIFPNYVLYSALFEAYEITQMNGPSLGVLNSLLCVLFVLHLFWFSLIVRLVIKFSSKEEVEGDLRSEDEAPTSSEEGSSRDGKKKE